MNNGHGGDVGVCSVLAALEYARVAALEAQPEDVEGDIGTGLVDDRNNSERYTDTANLQAVGQGIGVRDYA